jgi:hypothetical protein
MPASTSGPSPSPDDRCSSLTDSSTRHRAVGNRKQHTNSRIFTAMDWACLLEHRSHSSFCKRPPKPTIWRRCRCYPMPRGPKTSVSLERSIYWATKAADAGAPQAWLVWAYEYTGELGGDPPIWYQNRSHGRIIPAAYCWTRVYTCPAPSGSTTLIESFDNWQFQITMS